MNPTRIARPGICRTRIWIATASSAKKPDKCQGYGDNRLCDPGEVIARPVKKDPYFFDIPNAENQSQRHWFNLTY